MWFLGIPAIVAWLGTLIATVFGTFATWLITVQARRWATSALYVTAVVGVLTALQDGAYTLIDSLSISLPSQVIAGAALLLPSNTVACMLICLEVRFYCYAQDWAIKFLQARLTAT